MSVARKGAVMSAIIGGLFGWVWIIATISIPILIIWAIWGNGRWYHPVIALAVGGFCKALCREYKQQSEDLSYVASDKNYAEEWSNLSEEDKKSAVIEGFRASNESYGAGKAFVDNLILDNDQKGYFDDVVLGISLLYDQQNLQKPYQAVCPAYVMDYILDKNNQK